MSPAEVEKLLGILDWIDDSVTKKQAERAALSSVKDSEFWRTYYKGEIAGLEKVGEELNRRFYTEISLGVLNEKLAAILNEGRTAKTIILDDGTCLEIRTSKSR